MYVYICMYIYICMYVYVCIIYIYMYVYMYVYIYMCACSGSFSLPPSLGDKRFSFFCFISGSDFLISVVNCCLSFVSVPKCVLGEVGYFIVQGRLGWVQRQHEMETDSAPPVLEYDVDK